MVVIAVNSMVMWTLMGGILGGPSKEYHNNFSGLWVFVALGIQFVVNLIVVSLVTGDIYPEVSIESPMDSTGPEDKKKLEQFLIEEELTKSSSQEVKQPASKMTQNQHNPENPDKEAHSEEELGKKEELKPFFKLKAAVTAMWLPAVVGDKRNMFISASLSALVTRIVMFMVSVILAFYFQEEINEDPFILWCQSNWSEPAKNNNFTVLCTFAGTNTTPVFSRPCFDNSEFQKIRICDKDETLFRVLLALVIFLCNLASLLASLRLNRIVNYVEMYKISKSFLGFKTQPILHRSAVFQIVGSDAKDNIKLFDEILQDGEDLSGFINRPNSQGFTPLYNACERQSTQKVSQLLRAGADANLPIANGQTPLHIACEKEATEIVFNLLSFGATVLRDTKGAEPQVVNILIALLNLDEEDDNQLLNKILAVPNVTTFINQLNLAGQSVLHVAFEKESLSKVRQLVEAGADINQFTSSGETLLHLACEQTSTQMVHELLNNGANILQDAKGNHPRVADVLIKLIDSEKEEDALALKIFLGGKNVPNFINMTTVSGRTALHAACERLSFKTTFQLVNAGARSFRDHNGEKPSWESLFFALKVSEKAEDLKLLEEVSKWEKISFIISTNPSMKNFPTLTLSSKYSDLELFERALAGRNLFKYKGKTFINQPTSDNAGSTPLHLACEVGSPRKAFLLLQAGARLQLDNAGEKPKVENMFKGCKFRASQERLYRLRNEEEVLFSELVSSAGPGGWPTGIQHVIESDSILERLKIWDGFIGVAKEEAKNRVFDAFGKNLKLTSIILPLSWTREEREEMKEIIGKWNNNHSNKCEYTRVFIELAFCLDCRDQPKRIPCIDECS